MNAGTGFRVAVGVHLAILYVLTFGMRGTLFGLWHYAAAAILTVLMGAIVVLFTVDMSTPTPHGLSKAVDAIIGIGWAAVVGFLVSNFWHASARASN